MFYTKNPIQYSNISVYIYNNVPQYNSFKFSILQKLEVVFLQESAKNNS